MAGHMRRMALSGFGVRAAAAGWLDDAFAHDLSSLYPFPFLIAYKITGCLITLKYLLIIIILMESLGVKRLHAQHS